MSHEVCVMSLVSQKSDLNLFQPPNVVPKIRSTKVVTDRFINRNQLLLLLGSESNEGQLSDLRWKINESSHH